MQVSARFGPRDSRIYDITIAAKYADDAEAEKSSKQRGEIAAAIATALDDFLSDELAQGRTAPSEVRITLRVHDSGS
jgi:hypothetical protein